MKHAILAAIALAATATPAFAQDAQPFEGPFIGASAGWNRAEAAGRTEGGQPLDGEAARDSVVIGAFAGYDHKVVDRVVLGAEAGFSIALDDSSAGRSAGNQITLDERYSFDLTGRAGYLVTDDVLIYARGGYANSRVRTEIEQAGGVATRSDNRDGWLVALNGMKTALEQRDHEAFSAYIDFDKLRSSLREELAAQAAINAAESDNPFEQMGIAAGAAIADPLIDRLVTPTAIRIAFERRTSEQPKNSSDDMFGNLASEGTIERSGFGSFKLVTKE